MLSTTANNIWPKRYFLLTLKTGVPECFTTETFVVLYSIDDDRPTKYVCKNENVGLFQAGSWLQKKKKTHTHKVRKIQNNALGLREAIKWGFLNAARIL